MKNQTPGQGPAGGSLGLGGCGAVCSGALSEDEEPLAGCHVPLAVGVGTRGRSPGQWGQMPSLGLARRGGSLRVGRGWTGRSGHTLGPRHAARRGGQTGRFCHPYSRSRGGWAVLGVCTRHSSEPSRGLSLGSPPPARPLSNGSRYHGRSGLRGGPSQSAFARAVRGPPRGSAAGNGEPSVGLSGSSVGDKRHPHFSAPRGKVYMSGLASKAPEPALWPPRPRWQRLQASWVPRADDPLAPCSPVSCP